MLHQQLVIVLFARIRLLCILKGFNSAENTPRRRRNMRMGRVIQRFTDALNI